ILAYILVGENLQPIAYVGFFIIIATSFLLNFDYKKLKINHAFLLMLTVAFMVSIREVLNKYSLNNVDYISVLFWVSFISTGFGLLMLLLPKINKDIVNSFTGYKKNFRYFILTEFFAAVAHFLGTFALAKIPVVLKSSLGATQPIFVLILSFILYKKIGGQFKENLDAKHIIQKLISFVIIICGVILVFLGSIK
ncbi:MAG: hypothetical protein LBU68_00305, partial [Rickettsiales bacterium]|nr:hypothetical protein [Rickettsiales bacterium]